MSVRSPEDIAHPFRFDCPQCRERWQDACEEPANTWESFRAALDRETRVQADQHEREALAQHLRQIRRHAGTARHILGLDGRPTTPAERLMADDELCELIARCDMLLLGLAER
jgi:hypothetical protein